MGNKYIKNVKLFMDQIKIYFFFILVSCYSLFNRFEIYEYFEVMLENLNRFSKFDCFCKVIKKFYYLI